MERGTTSSGSTTTMAEMLEVVLINGSMIKGVLTLEVIMARQEVKATLSTT
jgi:Tfp pilus assembly pilus retraction ATPase PilT